MGLFDFVRSQFIEVIEWLDQTNDTLVYRFPVQGNEIKMGAKLVVREGQAAVFINEGTVADVFEPGMHTLSTQNMPLLSKLKAWKYGFNSPFKAEVYFISTRLFTDIGWGTANPVLMRDAEFGMVRVRAYGIFSMKVGNPEKLIKEVVGTDGYFTTEEITGQLKKTIVSGFSDMLGSQKIPVLDLAGNYESTATKLKAKLQPEFADHGFELAKLVVENVSLPPEVEKVIDQRTGMGVIGNGNMGTYAQFQMAQNMGNSKGGGMANQAAEMAAGIAMGQQMMQAFTQNAHQQQVQPPPAQAPAAPPAPAVAAGAEDRFLTLARTALKNTGGQLNAAMQGMLDSNRKRSGLSEEQANALIERAKAELGLNTSAMDEYKEILTVFLSDGQISDDERAILIERQVELNLTEEQVAKIEADVRRG